MIFKLFSINKYFLVSFNKDNLNWNHNFYVIKIFNFNNNLKLKYINN